MPIQNNRPQPLDQNNPAPAPAPGASTNTVNNNGKFEFTSAKRAVTTVFDHLEDLNPFIKELRTKAGDARDKDNFIKYDEKLATLTQDDHIDKAKEIKRSNAMAQEKLEKSLNELTPVSYKFAFNVLMYKFPELFAKYTNTGKQQSAQDGSTQGDTRKANVIAHTGLASIAANKIKDTLAENDKKSDAERMSPEDKKELESILAFFPGDGEKIDTAALVEYYKNNHAELPKDIRNIFDKDLQRAIAKANEAKNQYENTINHPKLGGLPDSYEGKPGERAWLNKLLTASKDVGQYYNYTVDEALSTFNPQPWQPEFEISYPLVTLVRGFRPGFEGAGAKYLMTPTQGYVNQALTQDIPSPRFILLEGAESLS